MALRKDARGARGLFNTETLIRAETALSRDLQDVKNIMRLSGATQSQAESSTVLYTIVACADLAGEEDVSKYCLTRLGDVVKKYEEKYNKLESDRAKMESQLAAEQDRLDNLEKELAAKETECNRREANLAEQEEAINNKDPLARAVYCAEYLRKRLLKAPGVEVAFTEGVARIFAAAIKEEKK